MSGMVERGEARDENRQEPDYADLVQSAKEVGFPVEGTQGLLTHGYS